MSGSGVPVFALQLHDGRLLIGGSQQWMEYTNQMDKISQYLATHG